MKRNLLWKHLIASVFTLLLCAGGNPWAQTSNFFYGFETPSTGPAQWSPDIRVASGTNGINAASGAWYGSAPSSSYTLFGGYNAMFPPCGFKTRLDIYLDPAKPWPNDRRFDYSVAISNPAGAHRRDFVFNVGFYNDAAAPGAGPRYVISASNGSGRPNSNPRNIARNPQIIAANAWYTFEHSFRNNGGSLAVDMKIYFGNVVVAAWTLSDPSDIIGTTVGGNRYGWVLNNEFAPLGVDNASLTVNDADFDGICDNVDNCPTTANASQADMNNDGQGDACDDTDGDGILDAVDNCPTTPNAGQADMNNDGQGDACDDTDGDGILDAIDNCPTTPNAGQADMNNDGQGDACDDTDGDGIVDAIDNCPTTPNAGQADMNNDGQGDACDDTDGDGELDNVDCAPLDKKNNKVIVCHKGKPICIARSAVAAHIAHGDSEGPCPVAPIANEEINESLLSVEGKFVAFTYPNPFTKSTRIQYSLPYDSKVSLIVYDMMGRVIITLVNGERKAGSYNVDFDASKLRAGNYYYRINAISNKKEFNKTGRMIKAK